MTAIYWQNDWMQLIYLKQSGVSSKPITKITLIAETKYRCTFSAPQNGDCEGQRFGTHGQNLQNEYLFSISLPRFFKYSFTQLFLVISHDLFRNFVNLFMFSRSFCDFVSCSVARDRKTLNQELHLCQQKIKMSNPYTSWLPRISMLNFQNYVFMIF